MDKLSYFKRQDEIDDLIYDEQIKLIFSKESVEEFLTIAKRPKFQKFFADESIHELLQLFDKYGKLIDVAVDIKECRDNKDNFLLSWQWRAKQTI